MFSYDTLEYGAFCRLEFKMAAFAGKTLNTVLYGMLFAYTRKLIKSKQYNNSHWFLTEGASIFFFFSIFILHGTEIDDGRHHMALHNYDQTNANYNFLEPKQCR